jgi:hypothetical protein
MKPTLDSCAELLAQPTYEAFVLRLLDEPLGAWIAVGDALRELRLNGEMRSASPGIHTYATWMNLPGAEQAEDGEREQYEPGYVFILFHDFESGATLTATYNRDHLWRTHRGVKGVDAGLLVSSKKRPIPG